MEDDVVGYFIFLVLILGFFTILVLQAFVLFFDFVHFLIWKERMHTAIRLPFEITALCIIPFIVLTCSLGDSLKNTISSELTYSCLILSIVSYFISTYITKTFPKQMNMILVISILSGYGICLVFITIEETTDNIPYTLLGCIPILFTFTIALIQLYKRCKKAWKSKKDATFI